MSRILLAKSPPKCLEYTSENCKDAHLGDGFVDSDFDRTFLQITLEPIETFQKANELLHTIFGYRQGKTFDNLLDPKINIVHSTKVKAIIDVSH